MAFLAQLNSLVASASKRWISNHTSISPDLAERERKARAELLLLHLGGWLLGRRRRLWLQPNYAKLFFAFYVVTHEYSFCAVRVVNRGIL